ncbi:protein WVD2-like 7 [Capsicum galapagoense]
MAGGIEEPFRLSFQADSWQSGSISFGRFENEGLCWERRSSFTHNRYLEEVEKCIKPGSVTEKRDGADSQASNDGSENIDYDGDFEHVNEIGHSACFVENHDKADTLLENGKYQARENEGYAGRFEHVNEVGHSARFDENYDRLTHLSKNGKYRAENTSYGGDSERVNEVGDSARFEESFDGSNNGDIEVTEFVILDQTDQDNNSSDVLRSVPERLEAEAKFNLSAGNSAFNDSEVSLGSKANVLNQHKSTEEQPIARKVVASRASCTEKVSHRLYQSVNRDKESVNSCQPVVKQNGSSFYFKTEERARKRKEFFMKIEEKVHAKEEETRQLQARTQEKKEAEIKQLWRNLNFKATPMPAFYREPDHRSEKIKVSLGSKANVLNQPKRKVVASRASCTEKVSHRLYQSVNRDKESVNSCQPVVKQNGSSFYFKTEERARKRKEFFMKIEEKVHAKEEETRQLQARTQEKKEAEIKQLWRNLNFKATPMPAFYREPDHRSEKIKVSLGSKANVLNQPKRKVVASRASCTEKVSHRLYQSVNRDKESVNSCQPVVKQNGSSFYFKTEERARKRKEFFMKIEEKVHAKEEETRQLQARTQENKEAEIKQLRRNINFKATPMPAFYREPGCRSKKNKDGQSWEEAGARAAELASKTKSQSRPSTAAGARATSATENTVSEVTIHPSAELSDSSVPSAATSKTSKQTQSNRTVAPKRDQEKRQVANSPRPRTSDSIRRNKDFKAEDKTKVLSRRTGNHATRKDVRSVDLSHSTRVGRLAVGVAS